MSAEAGATARPPVGSTWKHHSGRVYLVLGFANLREPARPDYPATIRYCDAEGHEYAAPLAGWHGRMTWLADPQPGPRPFDAEHARRVCELLSANSALVERCRTAERQVKELDRLRRAVAHAAGSLEGLPDGHAFRFVWYDDDMDSGEPFFTAGMLRRAAAAMAQS